MKTTNKDNRLRAARLEAGLKQVELTARAGLSLPLVNRLERWPSLRCSAATAQRLAAALGVEPETIFPGMGKKGQRP